MQDTRSYVQYRLLAAKAIPTLCCPSLLLSMTHCLPLGSWTVYSESSICNDVHIGCKGNTGTCMLSQHHAPIEHSNLYVSSGLLRWAQSLLVDCARQLVVTLDTQAKLSRCANLMKLCYAVHRQPT